MARTITAAERGYTQGLRPWSYGKLEITDSTGAWVDVSTGLRNIDWLNALTLSENIDGPTWRLSGSLLRNSGTLSLAPFRSDSLINLPGGSYATMLDLWRKWRASVAITRAGYPPTGTDWKELAQGRIDIIDVRDPNPEIAIDGRGEEAILLDRWIATERTYGSVGGIAMETVIQSMLDDNLGAGVVTLYTPVSPSYQMNTWTQQKMRLYDAIAAVADKAGYVVRYRYDSANVFRLTLYKPNRTATVEDWAIGPSEYTAIALNKIDKSGIRNFIKLRFAHPTLGTQTVIYPHMAGTGTVTCAAGAATFSSSQAGVLKNGSEIIVAGIPYTVSAFNGTTGATLLAQLTTGGVPTFSASAFTAHDTLSGAGSTVSLTRFGRNDLEIDLAFTTQVTDPTKAQAMCDAIGSDTEFPNLEQQFEGLGWWFVQLHDYGRFYANGVHYDTDQYGGVSSIQHQIAQATVKSTLGARGKPAGRYTGWRFISGAQGTSSAPPLQLAEALARITATTATTVTVTVTANPASPAQQVQFVGVTGGATLASGTAAGVWVTPDGSNNVWVFNRAAINGGVGQAQFRAGNTNSFQNDDDFVSIEEQGRDTVALASRARVTASTPTTLTVRVAVADPFPQGAGSGTIGYSELGLGGATTPATGQTVTPAATLTEAAGTFVDYTVTRPAFGLGAGRITFTATAANRTSDSDAVDVPEVDRDTVFLAARARVTATTPTTVTVRVAVADPYPQGAASATIAYQDLGSGGVSPGSGGTVTPASTLTEAAGTYIDYTVTRPAFGSGAGRVTFTATAANRGSSSDAVDVPEVDRDTQSISVRVLRISETADQVVVRVEAITPNAGATVTVNYDAGGLTISPATGGTFSATTSFGTTNHIDYTITRDTQGGSPRRVAFTVSASGFIDGTDGVDVPPNSTRERCKVVVTGSPTQASGTTPTRFDNWTESGFWDIGGLHDDATNPSRFTIQAGGNQGAYLLHASMAYQANVNGDRAVYIHKNGSAVASCVVRACAGASNTTIISAFYFDNAPSVGDYYEVYIWQNSGTTLGVGGGTAEEFFSIIHLW